MALHSGNRLSPVSRDGLPEMLQCSNSRNMEPVPDPVTAFAALAHPQRLGVVRLLMRHYPRRVAAGEIGAVLGLKPSTLSGYLAQLMDAGLITQERRATSLLYAASVDGAAALNAAWIGTVCGGRGWPETGAPGRRVRNVLFVGQGNAGPSLVAEAVLRSAAGEAVESFSAGLSGAGEPDPALVEFLARQGHDIGSLWCKPLSVWTEAGAPRMDIVITLGDRAASRAPDWPGCPHRASWRLLPDMPLEALHDDLGQRIGALARLDLALTPPERVQAVLDSMAEPPGSV
ncbi:MAG: helix-turn-helix domain-containing protein [Rhodobacteraceae bacterium]|nr:helix-turn-helix domain-containing protein [Paracoccaceae bacterium]